LTDNSLHFDFYLAEQLGMTVAQVRENVSHIEWLHWVSYFKLQAQREELEAKKGRVKKRG